MSPPNLRVSSRCRAFSHSSARRCRHQVSPGVVLRYGYFYGPDTWYAEPPKPPSIHLDAAAYAGLLSLDKGSGIYNIAEDGGAVSSAKAKRELGFDPAFLIRARLAQELEGWG